MWLVATTLDSVDRADFHHHKCYWSGWTAEPHLEELANMSFLKPDSRWNDSRRLGTRTVRRNGNLWMRHVKGKRRTMTPWKTRQAGQQQRRVSQTQTWEFFKGDGAGAESSGTACRCGEVRSRKDPLDSTVIRSLVSASHRCMRREIKTSCSRLKCKWEVWWHLLENRTLNCLLNNLLMTGTWEKYLWRGILRTWTYRSFILTSSYSNYYSWIQQDDQENIYLNFNFCFSYLHNCTTKGLLWQYVLYFHWGKSENNVLHLFQGCSY